MTLNSLNFKFAVLSYRNVWKFLIQSLNIINILNFQDISAIYWNFLHDFIKQKYRNFGKFKTDLDNNVGTFVTALEIGITIL